MDGKIALIIGGNGGIGSSITERFLRDGMRVCATYLSRSQELDRLSEEFGRDRIEAYPCDVRSENDVRSVVEKVLGERGKIDTVVFSVATPLSHRRILDTEWNDVFAHVEIQLKAILFVLKSLREQIRSKRRTRFIVVLSECCFGAPPKGLADYVTSKYGAMGLCKAMAVELVQYGSTVNMISPGMVDTPLLRDMPRKLTELTAHNNPMQRITLPRDVAGAASFLASDDADYLNGANILVTGGGVIS